MDIFVIYMLKNKGKSAKIATIDPFRNPHKNGA